MSPEELFTLTRCSELNPVVQETPGDAGVQANREVGTGQSVTLVAEQAISWYIYPKEI